MRILTIGHSNHPIDRLLALLQAHSVDVVADIRSQPYSRYASQFDKEPLASAVRSARRQYVYLGRELGGRPAGAEYYDAEGHVLYDRVARSAFFAEGIARLEKGLRDYRVAMLCAEENPAVCHRSLLVGRVLTERGIAVDHIRGDGSLVSDADLDAAGSDQMPLFEELAAAAWRSIPSVLPKRRPSSSSAF